MRVVEYVPGTSSAAPQSVPSEAAASPGGPDAEGLPMAMALAARLAPSVHNSQPWRFALTPEGLDVYEDAARGLKVLDPAGRDRVISCGAAALNAAVAARAAGRRAEVSVMPDPTRPQLVAGVRAGAAAPAGAEELALAAAVPQRRTHRRVYRSHAVAEADLLDLRGAVMAEGARLHLPDVTDRRALSHLLRRAVRRQVDDPELTQEVGSWLRHDPDADDGVPVHALGNAPFPVDSLAHPGHGGVADPREVEDELVRSTVLVVATRADTRADWVRAGMALQRLLLTATTLGLVASFVDQGTQDADLRQELARTLGLWDFPQIVLRIGRAVTETEPTPRRSLTDLLLQPPGRV